MFEKIMQNVKTKCPLVHNITNYVTVNDVANVVLACGASPIMADDIAEVEEITAICSSLNINIGTLNSRTIGSMIAAGKKANELNHPVVLDPVGIGASALRTSTAFELLDNIKFSVIRGNCSEIKNVYGHSAETKGVDVNINDRITEDNYKDFAALTKALSEKTSGVIALSGAIDIIANSKKAYAIRNGNALMSKITGTGCMLSGLIGAYIGANPDNILDAAATAVCIMGLAGEIAYDKIKKQNAGTSSYRTFIIDAISNMTYGILKGGAKIESI